MPKSRVFVVLLGLSAVVVLAAVFWVSGAEQRNIEQYPKITIPILNELEGDWYTAQIYDYRLLIEVEFSEEKRQHEIVVRENLLDSATISYWEGETWGAINPLPHSTAILFTVDGLFTTIRQSLINEVRDEVRSRFNESPVYPQIIYLGVVRQEGLLVEGTSAKITVLEFEVLGK